MKDPTTDDMQAVKWMNKMRETSIRGASMMISQFHIALEMLIIFCSSYMTMTTILI